MSTPTEVRNKDISASPAASRTLTSPATVDNDSAVAVSQTEKAVGKRRPSSKSRPPQMSGGAGEGQAKEIRGKKTIGRKPKLVRDSFTFPAEDHARLGELKQRALKSGREIKKSELLRAGLAALVAMPDETFFAALDGVERIKTGRPAR